MKNINFLRNAVLILLALLPLIYLAAVWETIPATVATHYDAHMQPNDFGPKSELWLVTGMMSGVALLVYFLLRNIHKIDPKRAGSTKPQVFNKLANATLLFVTALNMLIVLSAANQNVKLLDRAMLPLVGLMFVFLGNYMYSVKPNYFAGFRTPWALSDDENWRKTHRLGGTLWFAGGVAVTLLSLFLPAPAAYVAFIAVMIPIALIPLVYSYMLFRKTQAHA